MNIRILCYQKIGYWEALLPLINRAPFSQFGIMGLQGKKIGIMGLRPVWNWDYRNQLWNWDYGSPIKQNLDFPSTVNWDYGISPYLKLGLLDYTCFEIGIRLHWINFMFSVRKKSKRYEGARKKNTKWKKTQTFTNKNMRSNTLLQSNSHLRHMMLNKCMLVSACTSITLRMNIQMSLISKKAPF